MYHKTTSRIRHFLISRALKSQDAAGSLYKLGRIELAALSHYHYRLSTQINQSTWAKTLPSQSTNQILRALRNL
jgi:hypothetical protein